MSNCLNYGVPDTQCCATKTAGTCSNGLTIEWGDVCNQSGSVTAYSFKCVDLEAVAAQEAFGSFLS